jgi:hypothetical protein
LRIKARKDFQPDRADLDGKLLILGMRIGFQGTDIQSLPLARFLRYIGDPVFFFYPIFQGVDINVIGLAPFFLGLAAGAVCREDGTTVVSGSFHWLSSPFYSLKMIIANGINLS